MDFIIKAECLNLAKFWVHDRIKNRVPGDVKIASRAVVNYLRCP